MKHYTFVDYATQGYCALVGLLIFFFHRDRIPHWGWLVAGHAVCLLLVHLLIRVHAGPKRTPFVDFVRHFYPVLLYTGFYRESGDLNQMFYTGYLDPTFFRIEERLFGFQPSLAFVERLPYLVFSEIMYAAYFSYYVMIVGVGVALFIRNRSQFFHFVSITSFIFYCCYLTYIFTPVVGPRILWQEDAALWLPPSLTASQLPEVPNNLEAGPFFQIMKFIYRHFETPGAAFPSSHVAIAVATLYFTWKYLPRIRWAHLVMVILLSLSTVYGRYHYVVDVIAGALAPSLLIPISNWLYVRLQKPEV